MPNFGGAYVPWGGAQNTDWERTFRIKQAGVPVVLTGDTITAGIRADEDAGSDLKTFTVDNTQFASGIVTIRVAAASADLTPGNYWWYVEWTDVSASRTRAVYRGPFVVEPWV